MYINGLPLIDHKASSLCLLNTCSITQFISRANTNLFLVSTNRHKGFHQLATYCKANATTADFLSILEHNSRHIIVVVSVDFRHSFLVQHI